MDIFAVRVDDTDHTEKREQAEADKPYGRILPQICSLNKFNKRKLLQISCHVQVQVQVTYCQVFPIHIS